MRMYRRSLVAVAVVTLWLSACGSDDAEDQTATEEPTAGQPTTDPAEGGESEGAETDTGQTQTDVGAERFTVDHGCGFGFAKGSDEQDLGLIIFFTGPYTPAGPDLSEPIVLPDGQWSAEVQAGADLFADWCDDAIEEDDPIPRIDRTWTVIEGTITVTAIEPAADVARVEAKLAGAVLESTDGERLELEPVVLVNDLWGFFAG